MDIFCKNLLEEDEFSKILDNSIDINHSILKIKTKYKIREVLFGDERILLDGESYEYEYFKLNTTNKNVLEITCIGEGENKVRINEKRVISLKENSYIYDIFELARIREMATQGYNRIFMNEEKSEEENTIKNSFLGQLENVETVIKALQEIVQFARAVAKTPKVELIETEEVKDSNEVKKVSAQSARYFSMHPEYWYSEGNENPRPLKLLAESYEENADIYENQVVRFVLYKSKLICRNLLSLLKGSIGALSGNIIKAKREWLESDERSREEALLKINEIKKVLEKHQKYNREIKSLKYEIIALDHEYKDIRLYKNLKVKMTQKILYDKRYKIIFSNYINILKNLEFMIDIDIKIEYSRIYDYILVLLNGLCEGFESLGFEFKKLKESKGIKDLFDGKDEVLIKMIHYNKPILIEMKVDRVQSTFTKNIIVKIYSDNNLKNTIKLKLNFSVPKKEVTLEDVNLIYDNLKDNEINSTIIVNAMDIEDINISNKENEFKVITKLSNLGNNFLEMKDYEIYGGYRVGMLSFSSSSIFNLNENLKNFFRNKLIECGFRDSCTFCLGGEYEKINEGYYRCNLCKKEIAINKCAYCGKENIKILFKGNRNNSLLEEDIGKNLIENHKNYEIKRVSLGACYNKPYSNSGGYCGYCGKCSKVNKTCIRCNNAKLEEKKDGRIN